MDRTLEIFLCVTLLCISAISSNLWSNEDVLRLEENSVLKHEHKPYHKTLDICNDSELCKNENKRMQLSEELLVTNDGLALDEPIMNYFPAIFHKEPNYCSCGRKKKLIDLGPNYFPRYYPDMICLPGGCGNFACSPKSFKFWALKKRQEGDPKRGVEPVPMELRDHWIAENIVTTVDCECRP